MIYLQVGFNLLDILISALISAGAATDKLAIDDGFNLKDATPELRDIESRFTLFPGLARRTLLGLLESPPGGDNCGIILDRLLPFSFRTPRFDRLLFFAPDLGVEGTRLLGLP